MKRLLIFLIVLCLVCSSCDAPKQENGTADSPMGSSTLLSVQPSDEREKKVPSADFLKGQMEFSLRLFQETAGEKNGKNLLISPLSVAPALTMTANGAVGETLDEMLGVLSAPSLKDLNDNLSGYLNGLSAEELKLANSIWIREGKEIAREFLQTNSNYYDAEMYQAPFDETTLRDINQWVNTQTDGMIPKLLEQIGGDTVMYLINALTFDAEWKEPYLITRPGTFTAYDGTEQSAELMVSEEYRYLEEEQALGILRDYEGGSYRFAALMPHEGIDIYEYVESLTAEGLLNTLGNPKSGAAQAVLPKFSYEYEIKLNEVLKELGMPTAFDGDAADFSGMSPGLYISEVRHKTFIELTEKGTRAGAVTSVAMDESAPMFEQFITFDRPFVYFILDANTNLPVFMGILTNI